MSVKEHKSEKNNFLSLCKVVLQGLDKPGSSGCSWGGVCWGQGSEQHPESLCLCFREDGLCWECASGSPGSLRLSTEWTILVQADRWQFSLPTDLCWLLNTNKIKALQQIYFTQRDSIQRESSFYLARRGNFPTIISELDFIFMTVLDGGNFDSCYRVACACLGKALWEMLHFLWMKAVEKWCCLSLEAITATKEMDFWKAHVFVCLHNQEHVIVAISWPPW